MTEAQKIRQEYERYLSRDWNLYTPRVKDDFPDVPDYLGKYIDPTYKPVKYPGSKPSQDQKKDTDKDGVPDEVKNNADTLQIQNSPKSHAVAP